MSKFKTEIILISLGIFIIYSFFDYKKRISELENFGVETVAKTTKISGSKGGPIIHYIFVSNNKDYIGSCPIDKTSENKIHHFYKLIYSRRNPKINKINLEEEITDTSKITKAGFKKHTKVRKYDLNGNFIFEKDTLFFRR
jgi:hypothetical protein